jgi:hypothetical protein
MELLESGRDLVEAGKPQLRDEGGGAGKGVPEDERAHSVGVGVATLRRRLGQKPNPTEIGAILE